jgi:hypothetical protein
MRIGLAVAVSVLAAGVATGIIVVNEGDRTGNAVLQLRNNPSLAEGSSSDGLLEGNDRQGTTAVTPADCATPQALEAIRSVVPLAEGWTKVACANNDMLIEVSAGTDSSTLLVAHLVNPDSRRWQLEGIRTGQGEIVFGQFSPSAPSLQEIADEWANQ